MSFTRDNPVRLALMEVMRAIHRGEVKVVPKWPPIDHYCGNLIYQASNGWTIVVFNDCFEWDYVSEATSPEGETIDFKEIYGSWVKGPDGEDIDEGADFEEVEPKELTDEDGRFWGFSLEEAKRAERERPLGK